MSQFFTLPVKSIRRETPMAVSILLDTSKHASDFEFEAGQYLNLKLNIAGEEVRRAYSICSAPRSGELRIAVKEVEGGKASTFLNRSLKDGDNLTVSAPEGNFTLKKAGYAGGHLVLFAAGSGITPILSLLAEAQESHPAAKKTLIFGNSNAATTMLAEQVNQLAQAENITVAHVHTAAGSQDTLHTGRIDFSKTLQLMHEYGGKDAEQVYICGPSDMMQSVQNAVKDLGIADSKIQVEYFSTPVEDATPAASQPAPSAGPVQAKVKVTLDDEEFEFDLHTDGLVILDAALDQGIDAPFSCKGGICTSCRAIVKEGTVKMNKNFALTDEELEEGYVLTCQSHPTSPVVHIDYDDA